MLFRSAGALQISDGSSVWEEVVSTQELERLKVIDPFTFYAQYMQQPQLPGGNLIEEQWFMHYADKQEVMERCSRFFIFADTAMKEKQSADFSVFQLWGYEGNKRAYLLDQIRGKWAFPALVKNCLAFWEESRKTCNVKCIFIEDAVSGTSLIQVLKMQHGIPATPWRAKMFKVDKDDKVSRVQTATGPIYDGSVWLPSVDMHSWVNSFLDEAVAFSLNDSHAHDDQVDAMTMALTTMQAGGYKNATITASA